MPFPIGEFVVDVAGSPVHGRSAGLEDAPPVLMLHGSRCSSAIWETLGTLTLLAKLGCYVTAVDLPGYGRSPSSGLPPAEWLAELMHAISLPPAVIVAPSMSGNYAFPLLVARPELVRGFIAVAPAGVAHFLDPLTGWTRPMLVIWGENDRTIPLSDGQALARTAANGSLVVIPAGSHAPYINCTHDFHAAILPFIAKTLGLPGRTD